MHTSIQSFSYAKSLCYLNMETLFFKWKNIFSITDIVNLIKVTFYAFAVCMTWPDVWLIKNWKSNLPNQLLIFMPTREIQHYSIDCYCGKFDHLRFRIVYLGIGSKNTVPISPSVHTNQHVFFNILENYDKPLPNISFYSRHCILWIAYCCPSGRFTRF